MLLPSSVYSITKLIDACSVITKRIQLGLNQTASRAFERLFASRNELCISFQGLGKLAIHKFNRP